MAEAVAATYQNVGAMPEGARIKQFEQAAFNQAFELIPNGAVATVIALTEDDGLPMLVAVEGRQLYKLVFGEFELRSDDIPATFCEMINLDPAICTASAESIYAEAAPQDAPTRGTIWKFQIGNFGFHMETRFFPDRQEEGETFAQALAGAMGWGELG
jgi:hypothetical protein